MNELVISVLRFVPSWAYHFVFAALCWGGFNLFFLAPFVFDRVTLPDRTYFANEVYKYNRFYFYDEYSYEYIEKYTDCLYSKYFYYKRRNITIWTATFGVVNSIQKELDFYDVKTSTADMESFIDNIIEGKSYLKCGIYPVWNNGVEVKK